MEMQVDLKLHLKYILTIIFSGLQETDRKDSQESELKDLKIQIQNMKYQHKELIQTTQQTNKRIEELEIIHEELIENLLLLHLLQLNQLQTRDGKIQNLEPQHFLLELIIKKTEHRLLMMNEMKGKADFEVVNPVCPGACGNNIPIENMVEHMKVCAELNESVALKLNKEEKISYWYTNYKLEESRDWFIPWLRIVNEKDVLYIMHYSEEETKEVFYYTLKYVDDGGIPKSGKVGCAPLGISFQDAVDNNFTTNICCGTTMIFTMYKA